MAAEPSGRLGQYQLMERIGRGGMAEVHLACVTAPNGFRSLVAVKLVLPHLRDDPGFAAMFLREAAIASRLDHPNIVRIVDYGFEGEEQFLALEYVHGQSVREILRATAKLASRPTGVESASRPVGAESASRLTAAESASRASRPTAAESASRLTAAESASRASRPTAAESASRLTAAESVSRASRPTAAESVSRPRGAEWASRSPENETEEGLPLSTALSIVRSVAYALHHAHEVRDPSGQFLGLVHRDVSPANVLVRYDGVVKLVDFGIAKATKRIHTTIAGSLKGKMGYMSPEQCRCEPVDRRSDIFGLGILLYETTLGRRLFAAVNEYSVLGKVLRGEYLRPTAVDPNFPPGLEEVILKCLALDPEDRYPTAREVAHAIERFAAMDGRVISESAVAETMDELFPSEARQRIAMPEVEAASSSSITEPTTDSPLTLATGADFQQVRGPGSSRRALAIGAGIASAIWVGGFATYVLFSGRAPEPSASSSTAVAPATELIAPQSPEPHLDARSKRTRVEGGSTPTSTIVTARSQVVELQPASFSMPLADSERYTSIEGPPPSPPSPSLTLVTAPTPEITPAPGPTDAPNPPIEEAASAAVVAEPSVVSTDEVAASRGGPARSKKRSGKSTASSRAKARQAEPIHPPLVASPSSPKVQGLPPPPPPPAPVLYALPKPVEPKPASRNTEDERSERRPSDRESGNPEQWIEELDAIRPPR